MKHLVARQHVAGGECRFAFQLLVVGDEIRSGGVEQLLETVDDEIRLLISVDAVARAHDAQQVEAEAVGRGRFEAVDGFALRADDARAVDAQAFGGFDQAEFHRVPIQAGQLRQRFGTDAVRLDAALAVGLHVVGENRIHQ